LPPSGKERKESEEGAGLLKQRETPDVPAGRWRKANQQAAAK
jgi:hypothetical protein